MSIDVGGGLGRADDLGVELVELAEAPLLRPLVAEGRAVGGELERRELLPAFAEIGAADAGGEFGPKREQLAAAVLEACTSPWRRRRWSRRSSGRRPRSARSPASRPRRSRTAGARARRPRPPPGSGRRLRPQMLLGAPDGLRTLAHCRRALAKSSEQREERPELRWTGPALRVAIRYQSLSRRIRRNARDVALVALLLASRRSPPRSFP